MKSYLLKLRIIIEIIIIPILVLSSLLSRILKKKIDIGIGPDPNIGRIYHKKALKLFGYSAETFVFYRDILGGQYDISADLIFKNRYIRKLFSPYYLFYRAIIRYKALYIYFHGGPLWPTEILWKIEPFLYRLANIKLVLMPYGADIQDMTRCPNLLFRSTRCKDYRITKDKRKRIEKQIDIWTKYSDHIIAGCDWIDYLYHWDTLILAHFTIDIHSWEKNDDKIHNDNILNILHAPNHRNLKGTKYFINAVEELKKEGCNIELIIKEKIPNNELKKFISSADIIADQLIIGWYAQFALEGMCLEKPVLCYIRKDLEELYIAEGLLEKNELPLIKCDIFSIKEVIRELYNLKQTNPEKLKEKGIKSREFVIKHHSEEAIGKIFDKINKEIGINGNKKSI